MVMVEDVSGGCCDLVVSLTGEDNDIYADEPCTFKYMHCYSRLDQDPVSLNRTLSLPQWRGAGGCGESVLNVDREVFWRAFERLDAANSEMLLRKRSLNIIDGD